MNEDVKDGTTTTFNPQELAAKWTKEMAASKRWLQKWHNNGVIIENEYTAQGQTAIQILSSDNVARYNIFWANIQVILAAVYTKLPIPEVDRTHFDQNDDVARVAALILERIFDLELKNLDNSPADTYRLAIQDRFVAGMGQVWPRYEFTESKQQVPAIMGLDGKEVAEGYEKSIVTDEAVPLDYVRWDDFFYSPCRIWTERRWVARRVFWNKKKCTDRFGAKIADQLQYKKHSQSNSENDPFKLSPELCAEVFEIWDKNTKCVSWFSIGCPVVLDYKIDPLGLSGFFPAKKPLMATHVTSAFIPRPDYTMVQDQYEELNVIASRTMLLTEALKLVGVYDKQADGVQRMLNQAVMNQLIPVDNWAMFAEKGGIKGQVDWMPLEMVANALQLLSQRKAALVQEVYEILGLSDIMRGQSVASETATAQQLKAQYGSARMQRVQNEIAEFITEATRTRAEIICLHWQAETIIERSQIMETPDAQFAQQAVALLKSSSQMALRLTVHADTIAAPDWNQEKQLRVDFLQATSQFITMSMPLMQEMPGSTPFLIQIMQWAAAGFKGGKQIEGVLDQALMTLQKEPQQQPKSAKESQAVADAAKKDIAAAQAAMSASQAASQREADLKAQLAQVRTQATVDKGVSTVQKMLTEFECQITTLLDKDDTEDATRPGRAADKTDEAVGLVQTMHKNLVEQLGAMTAHLQTLGGPRDISITMPDGGTVSAQSAPQQALPPPDMAQLPAPAANVQPPMGPADMPQTVMTPRMPPAGPVT